MQFVEPDLGYLLNLESLELYQYSEKLRLVYEVRINVFTVFSSGKRKSAPNVRLFYSWVLSYSADTVI
jgi:hypothetical protein